MLNKISIKSETFYALLDILLLPFSIFYPIFIFLLVKNLTLNIEGVFILFALLVFGLFILFKRLPAFITKLTGWNHWKSLAFSLTLVTLATGTALLFLFSKSYSQDELLKLSVIYLSSMLAIIPSSIKNLKDIFEK